MWCFISYTLSMNTHTLGPMKRMNEFSLFFIKSVSHWKIHKPTILCPYPVHLCEFSSVQSLSRVRLFATPQIAAHQVSLSITNSWSLVKLMSIESVMPSSHLILCHPLLLLLPSTPSIRVFFQRVNSSHEVAKILEFQLQHQSFQWTSRTDLI